MSEIATATPQKQTKRIRTITEALRLIKEADPDSALTYHSIKQLVTDNKVKHFMSGNKVLVNYDDLLDKIGH